MCEIAALLWAIYLSEEMYFHFSECRATDDGMPQPDEIYCAVYRLMQK
jgi:hypothetical protein